MIDEQGVWDDLVEAEAHLRSALEYDLDPDVREHLLEALDRIVVKAL